uniref:Uncharacterized protein n=1 Tax=Anguilla anguilla TaxID=7936 RepID=A0A0E9XCE5_ANGAN
MPGSGLPIPDLLHAFLFLYVSMQAILTTASVGMLLKPFELCWTRNEVCSHRQLLG